MTTTRKAVMASAVALALVGLAHGGAVNFDFDGGTHTPGVDTFKISSFDWTPDNLIIQNTTPFGNTTNPIAFLAQGILGTLAKTAGGTVDPSTIQLTYQLRTYANVDSTFKYTTAGTVGTSFFDIFFHPTEIANQSTGCGYGTNQSAFCGGAAGFTGSGGIKILTGTATWNVDAAATLSQTNLTPNQVLDQSTDGNNNSDTVTTERLSLGQFSVDVNVISYDANFFLTNITSLDVDLKHEETGGGSPFGGAANPSDEVAGVVTKRDAAARLAFFGAGAVNDIGTGSCTTVEGSVCGVQLANDSSTVVQTTPEPGSLALLGLGLLGVAGAGMNFRRRRKV